MSALAPVALVPVALAAGAGFAGLWLAVARGWSEGADRRVLAVLGGLAAAATRPGRLHTALRDVAALGGDVFRIVALVFALAVLIPLGRGEAAAGLAALVAGGRLALAALKAVARRERPAREDHAVKTHTSSFPSGHAFNGSVLPLAAALLLGRGGPPGLFVGVLTLAVLLGLALGIARLLLGVHWPSDILAGWLLAAAWVCGVLAAAGV